MNGNEILRLMENRPGHLHVVVLNRREEEEGAGLDREYWERVNQVRDESLNFLFKCDI